jgi:hypothetical protein
MKHWVVVAVAVALAVGTAFARVGPASPGESPESASDSRGDHDVGNVVCTVSDIGVIGYMDFPNNAEGSGFVYPAGTQNRLFEGSLLVGTDDGGVRVSDAMRDENQVPNRDFSVAAGGDLVILTPGAHADQQGWAMYEDGGAPNPIYSWASDPYDDFVNFRYVIRNMGASTVDNVYAGIFMDWDVDPTTAVDNSDYDSGNDLGYATGAAGGVPYAGVVSLSHSPPATFRSLSNPNEVYPPHCTEADKWSWLIAGFSNVSNSGEDLSLVMANGPFSLAPGASEVVGFALVGGGDLADLQANAQAAKSTWGILPVELGSFEAVAGAGRVILRWTIAGDQDTYGFNVYRSATPAGNRLQLNEGLVRSAGEYTFTDYGVAAGTTYYYWLEEVSLDGETALHGPMSASVPAWPEVALLEDPSPNPVAGATTIWYGLREEAPVSVALYDLSGKVVRTLVDGVMISGAHRVAWDGTDRVGRPLAHGVYLCRLETPHASASKRLIVVR